MSEKKITGKRFSKIESRTISSKDRPEEQEAFFDDIENTPTTHWKTFSNVLLRWKGIAISILKSKGLPSAPVVAGETEKGSYSEFLEHHIIKRLNYSHDSQEGLAARMLTLIQRLGSAKAEDALLLAFELGEISSLLKTYAIEGSQNRDNAKQTRLKIWAAELAKELTESHERFPKAWSSIPEEDSDKRYCGFEVFRSYNDNNKEVLKARGFNS